MNPRILLPNSRVANHYSRRVQQILSRFNDIREQIQKNEGVKGARVENEVRKFLLEFLPDKYKYGSGIVIDSSGGECDRSKQEDILIIDKFFNPKLFLDEEPTVYPVEVIYCGIEVKTSTDETSLKNAIENIASLKRLNYIKEPVTFTRSNGVIWSETTKPLGVIFSFETKIRNAETLLKHFNDGIKEIEKENRPDLICILNRGLFGINPASEKPQFRLYGLLGVDDEGKMNALEIDGNPTDEQVFVSNGQFYPIMNMNDKCYPVDVARNFIAFLGILYQMLLGKVISPSSNLLAHYVLIWFTHYLYKDFEN